MQQRFYFKIELSGIGSTVEEAWQDATESFSLDFGEFNEASEGEPICYDCYEALEPDYMMDTVIDKYDDGYHSSCYFS